ncbi:MAG: DNA polymerase III subunit beta [Gammaproteobacteria bacterium]
MEILVDKDDWVGALQTTSGIVERKHTKPILANVLITVEPSGGLHLTATDQGIELCCDVVGEVLDPGAGQATIPTKKCLDICRSFPDGTPIKLRIDGGRAIISAQRSRFTLSTLPAEEFPIFGGGSITKTVNIPSELLKGLISKTAFAMAQQDVRFYLNGLLLDVSSDRVTLVGADGHRMAVVGALVPDLPADHAFKVIIPRKAVLEMQRLLPTTGMVSVGATDKFLRLTTDNFLFLCRLVDGRFPDYQRIIPSGSELEFVVNRSELKSALTRIAIISHDKQKGVRFYIEQGLLRLRVHNPDQEEAFEELEVDFYSFWW